MHYITQAGSCSTSLTLNKLGKIVPGSNVPVASEAQVTAQLLVMCIFELVMAVSQRGAPELSMAGSSL